jgi:hypothetical protein
VIIETESDLDPAIILRDLKKIPNTIRVRNLF